MVYSAKTNWKFDETVTEQDLNRIEQGIATSDGELISQDSNTVTLVQGQQIVTVDRKSAFVNPVLRGRTLVNLLGRDGNCETLSSFGYGGTSPILDNSISKYGIGSLKFTHAAGQNGYITKVYFIDRTKKYVLVSDVYVQSQSSATSSMSVGFGNPDFSNQHNSVVDATKLNTWQTVFIRFDGTGLTGDSVNIIIGKTSGLGAATFNIDGVRLCQVGDAEYTALASMAADQVAAKYPYVDSVQAVKDVYIIGYGENLLPPFMEWENSDALNNKVISPYAAETYCAGTASQFFRYYAPCLPNQAYTFACETSSATVKSYYYFADASKARISTTRYTGTNTTPPTAAFIEVVVKNGNAANLSQADISGTFLHSNPTLSIGSTAKPFRAREDSYLYLYGTSFHSNSDGSVADQLFWRNGEPHKLARFREMVLDGSLNWSYVSSVTGAKQVLLYIGDNVIDTERIVKYDGKIIQHAFPISGGDQSYLMGGTDQRLFLSIQTSDSGWGADYTPTADEIKAYFNGWKMFNGSDVSADGSGMYNGTGTKAWAYRVYGNAGGTGYGYAGGSSILPTSQAPNPNGLWSPYKLVYQLAQTAEEAVPYEGGITLHEGANQIEVGCGVVVRERANVYKTSYGGTINYDDAAVDRSSVLKNRALKIAKVYKGSLPDTWVISTANPYGKERAYTLNYDQSAAYTVTYLALDTYKIGIPPLSITGTVAPNLKEAVDALTDDMTAVRRQVSALANTSAQKAPPGWITPTLLNGWVNWSAAYTAAYYKNEVGEVRLKGYIKGGATVGGTVILMLPAGYRPKEALFFAVLCAGSLGVVIVQPTGELMISVLAGNSDLSLSNIAFKADQ